MSYFDTDTRQIEKVFPDMLNAEDFAFALGSFEPSLHLSMTSWKRVDDCSTNPPAGLISSSPEEPEVSLEEVRKQEIERHRMVANYVRSKPPPAIQESLALRKRLTSDSKLHRNALEPNYKQEIVMAQFCAQHLPAVVERLVLFPTMFDDPTDNVNFELCNSYTTTLLHFSRSQYFLKYLHSNDPRALGGKRLTETLVARFIMAVPLWIENIKGRQIEWRESCIRFLKHALNLLNLLFLAFLKLHVDCLITEDMQKALFDALRAIEQVLGHINNDSISGTCRRLIFLVKKDHMEHIPFAAQVKREAAEQKKTFGMKRWNYCALPGCESKENLRACARLVFIPIFPIFESNT